MVLPLQDYVSSTTHLQNSSNSQLKITKSWDGPIVELLAFGTLSEQNFITIPQSDEPRANVTIGRNQSKEVFDLIDGSVMTMRYQRNRTFPPSSFASIPHRNSSYEV